MLYAMTAVHPDGSCLDPVRSDPDAAACTAFRALAQDDRFMGLWGRPALMYASPEGSGGRMREWVVSEPGAWALTYSLTDHGSPSRDDILDPGEVRAVWSVMKDLVWNDWRDEEYDLTFKQRESLVLFLSICVEHGLAITYG